VIADELINRIIESNAKWIFCDEEYATANLRAASKIPWPVQVIVSGNAKYCTSLDDILHEVNEHGMLLTVDI
jgi:hypothetical protein